MNFLPTTQIELKKLGWSQLDIILITGDAYVDHPSFGVAVIGRVLEAKGFKVGIISQPDWKDTKDFEKLGKPKLFFGITSGNVDSMVNHYTPNKKLRRSDDYTPNSEYGKRPNRAVIVYANRVREAFPDVPIIIGGIEASLRRLAHYDYWDDKVRRSILLDSRADILVYGMGEKQITEIAERLNKDEGVDELKDIRGTVVKVKNLSEIKEDYVEIPSLEEISQDKIKYCDAFRHYYDNLNPYDAKIVVQKSGDWYVIQNKPPLALSEKEIDAIYALPYTKKPHPIYKSQNIKAYEMIKDSITTHRGCFGDCSFCSLTLHQGKSIQSRSENSIIQEAMKLTKDKDFKGIISDLGGPTANMYKIGCRINGWEKGCKRKSCIFPNICKHLEKSHKAQTELLKKIRQIKGVRKAFVSSGLRFDTAMLDLEYLEELLKYHISGHLKIAPEHISKKVTDLMAKPDGTSFEKFLELFNKINKKNKKEQYLVPYLISAHPGCEYHDMIELANFLKKHKLKVKQVQEFTPTPMTLSTCMYYTGLNPYNMKPVYVAKDNKERRRQKELIVTSKD
jgi:uncharacterized radical SAM protein YgiQ